MKETTEKLDKMTLAGSSMKKKNTTTPVTAERKNMYEVAKLKLVLHELDKEMVEQKFRLDQQRLLTKRSLQVVKMSTGSSFSSAECKSFDNDPWPIKTAIFSDPRLKAWKQREKNLQKFLRQRSAARRVSSGASRSRINSAVAVSEARQTDDNNNNEDIDNGLMLQVNSGNDASTTSESDKQPTLSSDRKLNTNTGETENNQNEKRMAENSGMNKMFQKQHVRHQSVYLRLRNLDVDVNEAASAAGEPSPIASASSQQKSSSALSFKAGPPPTRSFAYDLSDVDSEGNSADDGDSRDSGDEFECKTSCPRRGISGHQMAQLHLYSLPQKPFVARAKSAHPLSLQRSATDTQLLLSARQRAAHSAHPGYGRTPITSGRDESGDQGRQASARRRPQSSMPGYMGSKRRRPKSVSRYTADVFEEDGDANVTSSMGE